jgi:hypothetical protein
MRSIVCNVSLDAALSLIARHAPRELGGLPLFTRLPLQVILGNSTHKWTWRAGSFYTLAAWSLRAATGPSKDQHRSPITYFVSTTASSFSSSSILSANISQASSGL